MAAAGATEEMVEREDWTPQIALGTSIFIPDDYVSDLPVRLGLYRRLAQLVEPAEIDSFAGELIDRFGPLPDAVDNLLRVIAIKQLCRRARIARIEAGPRGAVLSFYENRFPNPDALVGFIQREDGTARLRTDHTLVLMRGWADPRQRTAGVHRLLEELAALAEPQGAAA